MICEKHGQSALGPRKGVIYCGHCNEPVQPSLQLLVIDLGDSCVVKVEKGTIPEACFKAVCSQWANGIVVNRPFADLRAALDGDKPKPRLELSSNIGEGLETYRLYHTDEPVGGSTVLSPYELDSIATLAGKPLPIWTGSGRWEKIFDGFLQMTCDIWRFTRE